VVGGNSIDWLLGSKLAHHTPAVTLLACSLELTNSKTIGSLVLAANNVMILLRVG
jgi:hypothetical protein